MAKQTEKKVKAGKEEVSLALAGEVMDEDTGELVPSPLPFDMTDGDLDKLLSKVEKAKDDDFFQEENELWKPRVEGDEFRGIYYGLIDDGKYKAHVFACKSEKTNKPMARKIRGSYVLNRELERVANGTPCRIVWDGKVQGEGGRSTNLYTVFQLKAAL